MVEKEQQLIDGASDVPSRRVKDTARKYVKALHEWKELGSVLEVLKPAVMEKMTEDDVRRLEVSFTDGDATIRYQVDRETKDETRIKCKKLSKKLSDPAE